MIWWKEENGVDRGEEERGVLRRECSNGGSDMTILFSYTYI